MVLNILFLLLLIILCIIKFKNNITKKDILFNETNIYEFLVFISGLLSINLFINYPTNKIIFKLINYIITLILILIPIFLIINNLFYTFLQTTISILIWLCGYYCGLCLGYLGFLIYIYKFTTNIITLTFIILIVTICISNNYNKVVNILFLIITMCFIFLILLFKLYKNLYKNAKKNKYNINLDIEYLPGIIVDKNLYKN